MDRKKLFDVIRAIKGEALTQNDVDSINAVLDPSDMKVSKRGIALMHEFEGYRSTTYPDPAPGNNGLPVTGGYGTTRDENGKPFKLGVTKSKGYWDDLFERDLNEFSKGVEKVADKVTQNQFDALVSFAYNLGLGNLNSSTLLRKHKAGDYAGAANEFKRWNKAGGKVLAGLTRRREAEARLYRGDV